MKKAIITLAICYLSLAAIAAGAHMEGTRGNIKTCNVEIQSDITVKPDAIEVTTSTGNRMVIDQNHELFIDGETIGLDTDERALVESYAEQLRNTIPELVTVALEGVEIALTAVSEVFYTFSEDGPPASLLSSIDSIQEEVSARMYRDGNTIHIKGDEINGLEATMSDLELALEDAISESIGDLVVLVGRSLKESEGSLAERIASFTDQMESFEADIQTRITDKAEQLEQKAEGLCEQVYALQATESRLHQAMPVTRLFDVVKDS
jgi:hypothetical protein